MRETSGATLTVNPRREMRGIPELLRRIAVGEPGTGRGRDEIRASATRTANRTPPGKALIDIEPGVGVDEGGLQGTLSDVPRQTRCRATQRHRNAPFASLQSTFVQARNIAHSCFGSPSVSLSSRTRFPAGTGGRVLSSLAAAASTVESDCAASGIGRIQLANSLG